MYETSPLSTGANSAIISSFGLVADGAQELGRLELALAVDLDVELVLGRGLELEPGAAVGDDLGGEEVAAGGRVLGRGVVDAGRAHELADDDALGAVDDERAPLGHRREVAHVDALLELLAGLLDVEHDVDVERSAERQVPRPALELVVLRLAELVAREVQLHRLAGEVRDGADLVEEVAQALLHEPVVRVALELDEVRDGQDLRDARVRLALRGGGHETTISSHGHRALLASGQRHSRQGDTTIKVMEKKTGAALTDRICYRAALADVKRMEPVRAADRQVAIELRPRRHPPTDGRARAGPGTASASAMRDGGRAPAAVAT